MSMPWGKLGVDAALGEVLLLGIWMLCYREILWLIPLQVLLIPFCIYRKKDRRRKRMRSFKKGFVQLLQSLMTSLQAGYTMENACIAASRELEILYKNPSEPFLESFRPVTAGIALHVPVEKLFFDLARETRVEEIWQFATVLEIASTTGGDMIEIIRNAMEQLQEKMAAQEEIQVMLSGKVYEKNLMLLMPFFFLFYLSLVNGEYLAIFFHTLAGHILMSVLLAGIGGCFFWTEKIMEGIAIGS